MHNAMHSGPFRWLAIFCLVGAACGAQAKLVEEVIRVPVMVTNLYGKDVAQEIVVTVFHDDRVAGPFPLLLMNHGRSAEPAARLSLGRAKYSTAASWFARLGFLVAVPTRVGYGETGGEDVEDSGDCDRKRYAPGYDAAVTETLTVLAELRKRPNTLPDQAVVVGQSFGGATAVAVAARNPTGVQLAINFAGGGGGNPQTRVADPCGQFQLKALFKTYGATARIPMLWVYTENDKYFGPKLPREWFETFTAEGGKAEFVQFPPHGEDGHSLFTRFPGVWQPKVLDFLRRNGYPELRLLPKEKEIENDAMAPSRGTQSPEALH